MGGDSSVAPSTRAPVAVFVFNRPGHTERLFASLAGNSTAFERDIVVYADGPRRASDHAAVQAVREGLREWTRPFRARIVERDKNLGLARSVVSGVSELCASQGRVIVLEDDLVLAPDFLRFMDASLEHYRDDDAVMQIGGCTLAPPDDLTSDSFLLPVTSTWGWATWQRAWMHFNWQPQGWPNVRTDLAWRGRFDLGGVVNYLGMLEDRLAGRNDSWGILWWYAVSRRHGEVLYPRESLVVNAGFDGSGTHCGNTAAGAAPPRTCVGRFGSEPGRPLFPPNLVHDPAHLSRLAGHLSRGDD